MNGVVVVPTWMRPDLLRQCCDRLVLARGFERYRILFMLDRGHHRSAPKLLEQLPFPCRIVHQPVHGHKGNSWNVIDGLLRGLDMLEDENERIHLVEEDVLVAEDYFEWHEAVAGLANPEIASACWNQNGPPLENPCDGDRPFVYRWPKHQSLGVSFRPDVVERLHEILREGYFKDPGGTLDRLFPGSVIREGYTEQDGVFDRMVEKEGWGVVYPIVPRAYHAGVVGYHGGPRHAIRSCPLDDRPPVESLREIALTE